MSLPAARVKEEPGCVGPEVPEHVVKNEAEITDYVESAQEPSSFESADLNDKVTPASVKRELVVDAERETWCVDTGSSCHFNEDPLEELACVKQETSCLDGGVSEGTVAVKDELVLGPERVQRPGTNYVLCLPAASRACVVRLQRAPALEALVSGAGRDPETMEPDKKRKLYSDSQLAKALEGINAGMSIYQASRRFNIPQTTLRDKRAKRYTKDKCGPPTILHEREEKEIAEWVRRVSETGFSVTRQQLTEVVAKFVQNLNRPNPFKDGVPGKNWFRNFANRHPVVGENLTENITGKDKVTEKALKAWFDWVRWYLETRDLLSILDYPNRVFSCDEAAFFIRAKENEVFVKRDGGGNRVADEKECLTVLVNVSADGTTAPPMVLLPCKQLPVDIRVVSVPPLWGLGNSESGWMTMTTFQEYVTTVFYPWIVEKQIPLPIVIFLNSHGSLISLPLSEFCKEKGIILIALLANASRILQPLNVVFKSVKEAWRNVIRDFRSQSECIQLSHAEFMQELHKCFDVSLKAESIKNAFQICGLHPFNFESIDYRILFKQIKAGTLGLSSQKAAESFEDLVFLKQFEDRLSPVTLQAFRKNLGDQWTGEIEYEKLFEFWKKSTLNTLKLHQP